MFKSLQMRLDISEQIEIGSMLNQFVHSEKIQ